MVEIDGGWARKVFELVGLYINYYGWYLQKNYTTRCFDVAAAVDDDDDDVDESKAEGAGRF